MLALLSHPEQLALLRVHPDRLGAAVEELLRFDGPLQVPLARLEGRIALGTLLPRFPRLRLAVPAEQLTRLPGVLLNGLDALPVLLR